MAEGDVTLTAFNTQIVMTGTYAKEMDLQTASQAVALVNQTWSLTNGTGNNQANLLWFDSRSVSSGSPDDLDLYGNLVDIYGQTLNMVEIRVFYLRNKATSGYLTLGDGGVNHWPGWMMANTEGTELGAGSAILISNNTDGTTWPVITGTNDDLFRVDASAGTISYDVVVLAANA